MPWFVQAEDGKGGEVGPPVPLIAKDRDCAVRLARGVAVRAFTEAQATEAPEVEVFAVFRVEDASDRVGEEAGAWHIEDGAPVWYPWKPKGER